MHARWYVHFFLYNTRTTRRKHIIYMYRGLLFDVLDEFPISFQEHFVRNNSSIT